MDKEAQVKAPCESKVTSTKSPWFEQKHKKLVRKKQRLYNKAKNSGRKDHWDEYYAYRKTVQKELRRVKRAFYQKEETPGGVEETEVAVAEDDVEENQKEDIPEAGNETGVAREEDSGDVVENKKEEILEKEAEVTDI